MSVFHWWCSPKVHVQRTQPLKAYEYSVHNRPYPTSVIVCNQSIEMYSLDSDSNSGFQLENNSPLISHPPDSERGYHATEIGKRSCQMQKRDKQRVVGSAERPRRWTPCVCK
jgi:hypothetical protein